MENLGYLRTEYAREKMIESYRIEEKQRKEINDFALNIITDINERYKKINGITGEKDESGNL